MTIAIRKVLVPRFHRKVSQGQSVNIVIELVDAGYSSPLFDPSSIPIIYIYDPLENLVVDAGTMIKVDVGRYSYRFQTDINSVVGIYKCTFNAVNGSDLAIIEKISTFEIILATSLSTLSFSYLAIKDQNNVVWYWYIDIDNTLNAPNPSIPTSLGKVPISVTPIVVPNWLELENPTPEVRYVYPDLDGTVLVSSSEPAVGSGHIGSPTFTSIGGQGFQIDVNISDEVILVTV